MKKGLIALIIIFVIISFGAGYVVGFQEGIKLAVSYGLKFVDIDVDETMLSTAIFQYKNNIGGCLFTEENASILYEQGD